MKGAALEELERERGRLWDSLGNNLVPENLSQVERILSLGEETEERSRLERLLVLVSNVPRGSLDEVSGSVLPCDRDDLQRETTQRYKEAR